MDNEFCLITGASSGIGYELAKIFAKNGNNLILVARNKMELLNLKSVLQEEYAIFVKVLDYDLLLEDSVDKIFQFVKDNNIFVKYLVNCAGFGSSGFFHKIDEKKDLDIVYLNCYVLTKLTKKFMPKMISKKKGGVLNVASVAGFFPGPYMSVYYATKAYVLSLTDSLYLENRKNGIKISSLCPGAVATKFFSAADIDILKNRGKYRFMHSPETIAKIGYKGFMKNKMHITPFPYSFFMVFTSFFSRKFKASIIEFINRKAKMANFR